MTGYIFPLTMEEGSNIGNYGFPFIEEHRDRLVPFDFEESSIDMSVMAAPSYVYNGVIYECHRQYFEKKDSTINRIMLVSPINTMIENPALMKNKKHGYIVSYLQVSKNPGTKTDAITMDEYGWNSSKNDYVKINKTSMNLIDNKYACYSAFKRQCIDIKDTETNADLYYIPVKNLWVTDLDKLTLPKSMIVDENEEV